MTELFDNLDDLSPEQRELLALLLEEQGVTLPEERIPRVERAQSADGTSRAPLSFAQQRLWFLDLLEPGSPMYNIPAAVELSGELNVTALRAALQAVVDRHEPLRTRFVRDGDEPTQEILPRAGLPLPVADLSDMGLAAAEAEARRLAAEDAAAPFDLAAAPLLRARLLRLSETKHALLFNMHHIVSDGWSVGVLIREVAALYAAFLAHPDWSTEAAADAAGLPPLDTQYADYAVWQRGYLQGDTLRGQLDYWRQRLSGSPALLELPTDRPRPPVQSGRGDAEYFRLSREASEGLDRLAHDEGATVFMVLLAAFQTLLHRHAGQDDILVGTPVANRTRAELEPLIGFFVNTLVIRADFAANPTFRELLRQARDRVVEAQANQDAQFEMLVEELKPERNMSYTPLFQAMFAFQKATVERVQLPGLTLAPVDAHSGAAKFDLLLNLTDAPGGFAGSLEYNTDIFDPATIRLFLERFEVLARGIVAQPDQRVSSLPLLTEADRRRALVEWNDTAVDYGPTGALHELIEAQVDRTPDALAVMAEAAPPDAPRLDLSAQLTYRQLDARANQLAHFLRGRGIGADALVAVCAERSLEMMVALLGILKAGAAYVPVDPGYPADRIRYMLADCGATVLLTQAHLLQGAEWEAAPGMAVICLDTDWPEIAAQPATRLHVPLQPAGLAYMIYTSGSTGKPKGAMVHHTGIVNRLLWMQAEYGLVPAERVMQKTPFSFDVSVWEFFWPLLTGATVVFARPEGHKDALYLMRLIDAADITTLHFVPSMLAAFLSAAPEVGGESLTRVICSGEALAYDLQERFFARFPRAALRNLYGPTEAAVDVTHWPCAAGDPRKIVPIGYPVANTQMYVLNRDLQPVPPGAVGELYIAGVQVGRGYLNRPELTAERFLPDPFNKAQMTPMGGDGHDPSLFKSGASASSALNSEPIGARMYRTGDLARHLPDGAIEYLGRIDFQVKLRGFRIELGEIESTLRQHPALADAVVVARKADGSGDSQLIGYIAPKAGEQAPVVAELRRFLLGRLPDYMVPAVFVSLAALPLSPNGKVDRKALPAPVVDRAALGETYVAPATPTEELLASIWGRLLRAPKVGSRDNFFDLGGHSLLATQLVSRVRESFGVDLPLRSLFERPTVSTLAELIDRQRLGGDALLPAIAPAPREPDADGAVRLPLSFAQQRLWFLEQLDPGGVIYNIPSAVRLTGELDPDALEGALNDIVARHESLRTTFGDAGGKAHQVIWPTMPLSVTRVDLSAGPVEARETAALELARQETLRPFDLARGPLIRATLLKLGDTPEGQERVLLLTMHHIISDGWSVAVLIREFAQLYEGRVAAKPALLPSLPLQYADYAVWQRTWLEGEGGDAETSPLRRQLAYWREQLAGLPALLELPTDHPRPPALTYRGGLRTFQLPADLSERLRELGRREGVTLYMTLLAALETLLARLSGQDDFAIGSPVAGRNRAETESIIGFFINTLVMRSDLRASAGAPGSFRELLARVRQTSLDAYARQDVPFEMLVSSLDAKRSASHTPLFQVMLTLQNIPGELLTLPGLTLAAFEPPSETAKFDLNWTFVDDPAGLQGALEYSSDLFDAETADRFAACFVTLLAAAVEQPDQALAGLPILPEADRALIFGAWSDTRVAIDTDSTIYQRFEEQARRAPDALAVLAEQEVHGQTVVRSLTYGELNRRANQLARRLRGLGVGAEGIVGLTIERTTDLLVGVMGILKAGAAYLPLDPSYPADRLQYMLADSGAAVLVTYERFLTGEESGATICLDRDWPEISALPDDDVAPLAGPDNLAYVIYTSGSTGKPKGVTIPHRAALNLAGALHHAAYRHSAEHRPLRLSLNAPLAFDASVQQLVMLTQGHALYLVPQDARGDGAAFLAFIRRHRLDQFDCVPSQLKLILDAGLLDEGAAWTPSICFPGGEAIDDATWAKLAAAPATDFYNMYGPTECAVDSTTVSAREAPARATIGRPVANVRAYVLDRNFQPAPIGVPGELFLAGDGVGRGYLRRPDLTAERFLPDPFNRTQMTQMEKDAHDPSPLKSALSASSALDSEPAGARMYRTGDLVRWTRDGLLEFLGRVDFQVKVRGFRIELGEIEDRLRQHAAVSEAVVVAREIPGSGGKQLVAYLTAAADAAPSVGELRQHLLASLPDYMVPAIFVTLDAMPLTPNRKIDRKALPTPETAGLADTGKEYVEPETPAEQALAAVWAQVLGVPRVGRNDDFFELGGDSILSIQVVSRANQAGLRITPRQLFQAPTLATLAALAGTEAGQAVAQGPVEGPVALTPIQRRFFELDLAERNHWNQSILLSAAGQLDPAGLEAAVAALVAHHDALRLRFSEGATGWQARNAGLDEASPPPFAYVDLSALNDADFSAAVERRAGETQASLDIAAGPLFRAVYFDAGAERRGRLLLVIHHLAVDGVSWRILLEDLQNAYGQHRQADEVKLPPKTVSFQAWAEKLAAYAGSDAARAELDGWLARAGGWVSPLPVDNACAPEDNTESSAGQVAATLPPEDTAALLTAANAAYNTEVPDLLLAALAQTMEKWTGEGTLTVDLEGHGREEIGEEVDVSRTVGWFTTLYPARIDLPWGAGPAEAIIAAKEQLAAIPQRGLGYGLLRYGGPDDAREALAAAPQPEMAFNYLGQLDQALNAGGGVSPGGVSPLSPAPEMPGRDRAPANRRDHLLDVTAAVAGGRLSVSWTYSRAAHDESTVQQLANWHIEALQALISHCRSPEAGAYTPSDFPLAELDQKQLDKVLKKVKTK